MSPQIVVVPKCQRGQAHAKRISAHFTKAYASGDRFLTRNPERIGIQESTAGQFRRGYGKIYRFVHHGRFIVRQYWTTQM